MSAKQSSEMRHALILIRTEGMPVYEAARIAGVYASSVYRALAKRKKKKALDKRMA